MRAIVTGATGMIGMHLIEYLVQKDVEVLAVVNPASQRKNCILSQNYVTILECDLEQLPNVMPEKDYDYFFHLGWRGTHGAERNDLYIQEQNVKEALLMVDFAKKAGCTAFIGAGSQAEFGNGNEKKLNASYPAKPETGYGIGKYMAGILTRKRCEQLSIRHEWVRIFSIYGPNDGMHTMVMSGINSLLKGESPAYTKAEQEWDYLYVKDAVEALYLIAINGVDQKIYCLGSGQTRLLKEYIYDIRDAVNKDADVQIGALPYYEHQVMYLCADIEELSRDTGFKVKTSFSEGIKETVEWLKEKIANEEN